MAEYLIQDTTLDAIADAINVKTGGSSAMTPAEMVTAIESIPSGGGGAYVRKYTVTTASSCTKFSELSGMLFGTTNMFCVAVCVSPVPSSGAYIPIIFHQKESSHTVDNVIRSLSIETSQPSPSFSYSNATFGKTMQAGFVYDVYVYWE